MPASLPDNPLYCFCPFSDGDGDPPQIRILVEGLAFAIPTALVALTAVDGLVLADCLNRALGLDRVACGAALRGGSAALPPHRVAHLALHHRLARPAHRVDVPGDDARRMTVTMPMVMVRSVVSAMLLPTMTTIHVRLPLASPRSTPITRALHAEPPPPI